MMQLYFKIFWLPPVASAVMLYLAGRMGLLGRTGRLVVWFAVALLLQILGEIFSPAWTIGLVLQAVLAVYLAIRIKLG